VPKALGGESLSGRNVRFASQWDSGNDSIVAFLLERGVDRDKSTPLEEAENSGRGAAADLIRNTLKCQQAWCLGL
jgi:hypothetical protein